MYRACNVVKSVTGVGFFVDIVDVTAVSRVCNNASFTDYKQTQTYNVTNLRRLSRYRIMYNQTIHQST